MGGAAPANGSANADFGRQKSLEKINRELEEKSARERAAAVKMPYIDVATFPINPDILHLVPKEEAQSARLMPFYKSGKRLRAAVVDADKKETQDAVKKLEDQGYSVAVSLVSLASFNEGLKFYDTGQYRLKTEIKNIVKEEEIHYEKELENLAVLKDKIASSPAEEALNTLNVSAIKAGASDVHFQPEETLCAVRFRIDGVLHPVFDLDKAVFAGLANQLKYKAGMKLNITNEPQDGRFRFIVNERKIDVRVSSLPTEFGESFVCRILDSGRHFDSFEDLGFSGRCLEIMKSANELTQGMILVTGPTSSGKTTSLYVFLKNYNKPDIKIITLEDPVEYHLKGVTQSQVNEKRGYTFAGGLRSILRQDPDIVMIGEIRDLETASAAAQAALTGHVVLSTLHTNSAVETIPRLISIGLPSFILAPSLSVVVAQRLVRRLCVNCALDKEPTQDEKALFEKTLVDIKSVDPDFDMQSPEFIKKAAGCEVCSGTGYRGQVIIAEALAVDDEIRTAVQKNASLPEISAAARKNGILTMMEDAVLKIISGQTTLEEVHRVINA